MKSQLVIITRRREVTRCDSTKSCILTGCFANRNDSSGNIQPEDHADEWDEDHGLA